MKMSPLNAVFAALLATGLVSCSEDSETTGVTSTSQSVLRFEEYCNRDGLSQPLRQTFILLDAKTVKKAVLATEFAERNTFIRDLALAFANPKLALASGLSDPRERISVLLVPSDNSPAQLVFTGCLPGLSKEEEAKARAGGSGISEFFTGDALKSLESDAEKFQIGLIGGLTAAAKGGAETPEPQTGAFATTSLVRSLLASRGALEAAKGSVARYVIVTDLSAVNFENAEPEEKPNKQGQIAGFKSGGDFGLADIMIVQPPNTAPKGKEFIEGFFLSQGARLVSYSSGKPTSTERAPRSVSYFEGEAAYPSRTEKLKIRIADDGKGNLSSSWLTMVGSTNQSIPMTGQISCSSATICKTISDDKGFAQAWSPEPGGEPEFINELPFAGMRNFAFDIQGKELMGSVSDPMVQIANDGSKNSIEIKAERK